MHIRNPDFTKELRIRTKTNTEMELELGTMVEHGMSNYLGAIVSNDRETIYWVNDTKPLP